MNNRDYKQFAPGEYYHVYNRGNGKQAIFLDDEDRKFFLLRLKENLFPELNHTRTNPLEDHHQGKTHTPYTRKELPKGSFLLLCYVLMPNHYHLLIRQNGEISISKLLSKVCTSYSKYFNKKYKRVGHLFQDRFKAVLITSDSYLSWLSAYVHQNPKVGGLVKNLNDYAWSSYPDYTGRRKGILCSKEIILEIFEKDIKEYEKFVSESFDLIKGRKDLEDLLLDD